jgi:hypothetical protein
MGKDDLLLRTLPIAAQPDAVILPLPKLQKQSPWPTRSMQSKNKK